MRGWGEDRRALAPDGQGRDTAPAALQGSTHDADAADAVFAEEDARASRRGRILLAAGVLGGLGAAGILGWSLFEPKPHVAQRQVVTQVTRVALPPPPPPPPPPKTDPPPEPQVQPRLQERPLERVEPKPAEAPRPAPAAPPMGLGLPAGPGGANPYGIGQGGGDGYVVGGSGTGSGGGGSARAAAARQIEQAVQRALQSDERTKRGAWRVRARIWFGPTGQVTRVQLMGSSGDAARDAAIREVVGRIGISGWDASVPSPAITALSMS